MKLANSGEWFLSVLRHSLSQVTLNAFNLAFRPLALQPLHVPA
jgi:hypothetical protein